jgi:signal transduction histidine kinase/GAF domain-containing protein/CheY-like chemotaxis protein
MTLKSPLRVLLLEDDPGDAALIQELLETDGFACEANRVQTRAEFVAALENPEIDLILADHNLPAFDGLSALNLASRARPDLPFIFVSGSLGEELAIEALKIGATDYVLKTRLSRLVPAVHRALRETQQSAERKRAEALLAGEKRILEMLARGNSLSEILAELCRLVEEQTSGVLASVLLLDGDRLRHGAAPSLPRAYTEAIDGGLIGPSAGSCGTAAYRGQQVIVEDIATDPLWAEYRDVALPHSLRACWSTPIFSSQGNVIATFAMYYREPRRPSVRDQEIIEQITHLAGVAIERKMIEEKLQRNEYYLAEAQRLTHTGSWTLNSAGEVYWSQETFRIWAFDPQQPVPDRETILQRVHPDDRERVREHGTKAAHEASNYVEEFRIVLPDGTVRHIHAVGRPVFNASGELVEVVGTHVDVTERKHAEAERERLRELEADLARLNRVSMMGELAASLAHEIKQPITGAVLNAHSCLRYLEGEAPRVKEASRSASTMVKNVTRAADIIDRVRSLYGRGTSEREVVDVNEIVRDIAILLRDTAMRSSIAIHTKLAPELPAATADRIQLQQVLMNLMLNGIEAMKDTPGELTVASGPGEDGHLLVSVTDSGPGLPAGEGERIFEAFFTTKPQGSGMGLSISRRIVEAHGGRLWASSNPGRGATFRFSLPTGPAGGSPG